MTTINRDRRMWIASEITQSPDWRRLRNIDGKLLSNRYILHRDKYEVLPIRGFWSLTMYNDSNSSRRDRYAIEDRGKFAFNLDGSFGNFVQRGSPNEGKKSKSLLAAASYSFTMNFRLCWPKSEARWSFAAHGVKPA